MVSCLLVRPLFYVSLLSLLLVFGFVATASPAQSPSKPVSTSFRVFGPLPIGALGAEPLLSLQEGLLSTLDSISSFPSEAAEGGFAKWHNATYNRTTGLSTASLPSAQITYSAWAVSSVRINSAVQWLLRCTSATFIHSVSNNVTHRCAGDYYNNNQALCPLHLPKGPVRIYMALQGRSNNLSFSCTHFFPQHPPPVLVSLAPPIVPDVFLTPDLRTVLPAGSGHIGFRILNAHPNEHAVQGSLTLTSTSHCIRLASDTPFPQSLAPAQSSLIHTRISGGHACNIRAGTTLNVTVTLSYTVSSNVESTTIKFELQVRKWKPGESTTFTYLNSAGVIRAAAARAPKALCEKPHSCSTLLSLHGAGVNALRHAWTSSYIPKKNAWVLLPTGGSPYGMNWEGAQMFDALDALNALRKYLPGVPRAQRAFFTPRRDWALVAGHSMGGHGALVLSTHFPDLLVAALPASAWLSVETYGGGTPHEQMSFSDSALRSIFESAYDQYASDLHAENLLGIPFLARVGSKDKTVPPYNLRKFVRLLKQYEYAAYGKHAQSLVSLSEVPGKGHWFGGVVDDASLEPFLNRYLQSREKPILPAKFSIITTNPVTTGSRGGLRILALRASALMARLSVTRSPNNTWHISTQNVRRIGYKSVNGIRPIPTHLSIDNIDVRFRVREAGIDFCLVTARVWQKCKRFDATPRASGPLSGVFRRGAVQIVYSENSRRLRNVAVAIANDLHQRGLFATVLTDLVEVQQFNESINTIFLGGPNNNIIAAKLKQAGALCADVRALCIMPACTASTHKREIVFAKGAGVAYTARLGKDALAVVADGFDEDTISSATSFIPSLPARSVPDWVVFQRPRWGWAGYGGVVAAGFWDSHFQYDQWRSYPPRPERFSQGTASFVTVSRDGALRLAWWAALASIAVAVAIGSGLGVFCSSGARKTYRKLSFDKEGTEEAQALVADDGSNGEV